MDLTLADILTAGGVTVTAGLVTGLIALLKNAGQFGTWVDAKNEPLVAYLLSAVLVLASFVSYPSDQWTPEFAFAAFLAWFGIAKLSGGVHDVVQSRSLL